MSDQIGDQDQSNTSEPHATPSHAPPQADCQASSTSPAETASGAAFVSSASGESVPSVAPVTGEIVTACCGSAQAVHEQAAVPAAQAPQVPAAATTVAALSQAPTAVATLAAPQLTKAAGNDIAAALQTAPRAPTRARSNARRPRPSE